MGLFDELHGGSKPSVDTEVQAALEADPKLADITTETPPAEQNPEPASQDAAPEPAPAEQQPEPAAPEEKQPRHVPAAALAEEREKRRALEADIANMRGQMEALQRMFQPQQPQPGQQGQEQPPDPETDPIAALQHANRELASLKQAMQAQAVRTQVQQTTAEAALQFTSTTPDYPEAAQFLINQRYQELKAQNLPEQAIRAQMDQEVLGISVGALRANKNPAEAFYNIAKARGYAPKGTATIIPPAPKPAPVVDPAMAEAKRRAATGIAEGGAAPKSDLSPEDGANLSGAAFDAWFEKFARTQGRRSSNFRHN